MIPAGDATLDWGWATVCVQRHERMYMMGGELVSSDDDRFV
jgi:hypothetical protein